MKKSYPGWVDTPTEEGMWWVVDTAWPEDTGDLCRVFTLAEKLYAMFIDHHSPRLVGDMDGYKFFGPIVPPPT